MDPIYVKGAVISPGWIGRPELGVTDRPLTAPEIQKAAYSFPLGSPLFDFKQPVIDVQHDFKPQALAVEQFIAPEPIEFNNDIYDPGTWFLTSKVTDPTIQRMILNGELNGYSVGAFPEEYKQLLVKKGMFADVPEGGWFPLAVSLVKMPFYPKAVFKVFGPDDIIKKSLNFNKEVDTVADGDNAIAAMFGKLLDYVIKKEGSDDGKQYETELEKKVRELKEENSELKSENEKQSKKIDKLKSKSEKPPGKEEKDDDDEEEDEEDEKNKKKTKKSKKSKKGKKSKSKKTKEEKEESDEEEDEEDSEDNDDNDDEEVDEKEEKIIKKGLSPDDKKTKPTKSFNERAGMDPLGRNPKYL